LIEETQGLREGCCLQREVLQRLSQ
jgi:hypothetical protein